MPHRDAASSDRLPPAPPARNDAVPTDRPWLIRLNDEQRLAATARGNVCVLAGAGTGKTTALVAATQDRIQGDGMPPSAIIMTTFTKQAAAEIKERIKATGCPVPDQTGTLHSICAKIIRKNPSLVRDYPRGWKIATEYEVRKLLMDEVIPEVVSSDDVEAIRHIMNLRHASEIPIPVISNWTLGLISTLKGDSITPVDLARFGHDFRAPSSDGRLLSPLAIDRAETHPVAWRLARLCYEPLADAMKRHGWLEYDDLLLLTMVGLERDPDLRRRITSRIQTVMVDEFQDCSPIQQRLVSALAFSGDLVVVGDDGQSIYGWRNADVGGIRDFATREDVLTIRLDRNYRSSNAILEAGRTILAGDPRAIPSTLVAAGVHAHLDVLPTLTGYDDGETEVAQIARDVAGKIADGMAEEDISILCRANAHVAEVYYELVGLGVSAVSSHPLVWEKKDARYIIAVAALVGMTMGVVQEPPGDPHWQPAVPTKRSGILTDLDSGTLKFGLDGRSIMAMRDDLERIGLMATLDMIAQRNDTLRMLLVSVRKIAARFQEAGPMPMGALVSRIADETGLTFRLNRNRCTAERGVKGKDVRKTGSAQERLDREKQKSRDLKVLINVADGADTVRGFVKMGYVGLRAAEERDRGRPPAKPAVTIASIHAAKGKEWDTVYVYGATDRNLNLTGDEASMQYGEGHRLGYVAVTRAKRALHISWARRYGDDPHLHAPCPALMQMADGTIMLRGLVHEPPPEDPMPDAPEPGSRIEWMSDGGGNLVRLPPWRVRPPGFHP